MPTDTSLTGTGAGKIGPGRIGAAPIAAPGWTARKASTLRIVDCDVHHSFESPEQLHAEETLIFCSDFPHFDQNDPVTALPGISDELRRRIFSQNALEMLRLPGP